MSEIEKKIEEAFDVWLENFANSHTFPPGPCTGFKAGYLAALESKQTFQKCEICHDVELIKIE